MKSIKNMIKDESGVSPIVATLVLIVVAVVGAVAVGTIVGTFSTDVADQNNVGDVSGASATEIIIAGSTTVQPASEALAKEYMDKHPGIKITVQGGGSGAGIAAANNGLVDIGSASKVVDTVNDYPELTSYTIGGSAVVIIGDKDTVTATAVSATELKGLYQNGTAIGVTITNAVQRSEDSGTEETFAKFIGYKNSAGQLDTCDPSVKAATGNGGVADLVADTEGCIGFVDYGFYDADNHVLLNIAVGSDEFIPTHDHILASLKGEEDNPATTYVKGLTRPLNYLVKGTPSSIVKNYIDFCRAPGSIGIIEDVGYIPYVTFA